MKFWQKLKNKSKKKPAQVKRQKPKIFSKFCKKCYNAWYEIEKYTVPILKCLRCGGEDIGLDGIVTIDDEALGFLEKIKESINENNKKSLVSYGYLSEV